MLPDVYGYNIFNKNTYNLLILQLLFSGKQFYAQIR